MTEPDDAPYVLATTIVAREGEEDRVERALYECAVASNAEPGVFAYELSHSDRDPARFFVYEVYRDREARDAHRVSEHVARCGTEIGQRADFQIVPLRKMTLSEVGR